MEKEQKLSHCFTLGCAAGSSNKEADALKDSVFIEFLNTQTKDSDFRVDCFEQWYRGFRYSLSYKRI